MTLKISVPADFGLENLYLPRHGNIVIKLRHGKEMPANLLILSYNSAVFTNMFKDNLGTVYGTQHYDADAVVIFLRCCTRGY